MLSVLAGTIPPPLRACCLPLVITVTKFTRLCAFVFSSGSGMACGAGTKCPEDLKPYEWLMRV